MKASPRLPWQNPAGRLSTTSLALALALISTPIFSHSPLEHQRPEHLQGIHDQVLPSGPAMATHAPALERGDEAERAAEVRALLRQAVAETAQGNRERALELYEQAAELEPREGLPALGRFLALAGNEEQRAAFRERMHEDDELDVRLRARALSSVGDRAGGIALLNEAMEESGDVDLNALLLLVSMLDRSGERAQSLRLVADALAEGRTDNPLAAEELLLRLGTDGHLLEPELLVRALDAVFDALGSQAQEIGMREGVDALVFRLQEEDYFQVRDHLLEAAREGRAGGALLETRMLIHEDEHSDALRALEEAERRLADASPVTRRSILEEKLWLLRAMGHGEDARLLSAQLSEEAEGRTRSYLALDAARMAIARAEWSDARTAIDRVNPEDLDRLRRQLYHAAVFNILTHDGDIDGIVDHAANHAHEWNYEEREAIHDRIFELMQERSDRLALESRIRARMQDPEATSPPELWLLASRAAIEGRLKTNEIDALVRYTRERPDDVHALEDLAIVTIMAAMELPTLPPEMLARLPEGTAERIPRLADESIRALVRLRPYSNNAMGGYLAMLRETGREAEVATAFDVVVEETDNPHVLANIAYVYAISDFAEHALPLYERALEGAPNDINIRLNHAAALTRAGQWDQAINFYRGLIEHGINNRGWHLHFVIEVYYLAMEQLDRLDEAHAYFRELPARLEGKSWRAEAMEDIANIYATIERPADAVDFYELALETVEDEDHIRRLWHSKGMTWETSGQIEEAIAVYRRAREAHPDDRQLQVEMLLAEAKAEVDRDHGHDALQLLFGVAQDFPDKEEGKTAWYLIANVAEALEEMETAKEAYRSFLDANTVQFSMRRNARMRIAMLAGEEEYVALSEPYHGHERVHPAEEQRHDHDYQLGPVHDEGVQVYEGDHPDLHTGLDPDLIPQDHGNDRSASGSDGHEH